MSGRRVGEINLDLLREWIATRSRDEFWPLGKPGANGYSHVNVVGKVCQAHIIACQLDGNVCPPGLEHDHLCRFRACSNPSHLEHVTRRVNQERGVGFVAAKVAQTTCIYGNELIFRKSKSRPNGRRKCQTCDRIAHAERYALAKAGK
jgi:hypothetical protein